MAMLTYDELVVNLKVLKQVGKHQKINTQDVFLNVEAKSIIPEFVRRWRRGDDRNNTVLQINATVSTAIELIPQYPMLKKYLKEVIPGLENLKETYGSCSQTSARIEAILDRIEHIDCDQSIDVLAVDE